MPTAVHFECCLLPTKLCMSHRPTFANHLKSLGRTVFRDNRIDGICPENPCQQLCFSVRRFLPAELSPSYCLRLPFRPPCRHSRIAPSHRSPSYFPRFPFRPPRRHSRIAPSQSTLSSLCIAPSHRNSPHMLFLTVSPPSTLSSLPHRSFPPELSPSYFPRFPPRPPSRRFRIAPSPRSSPQAISHGFSSVHPIVASVWLPRSYPQVISHGFPSVHTTVASKSLLPNGAPPKLFPTVSLPSTLSRSSPQAISHSFHSVHPVLTPVSLLPTEALPKIYFPRFPLRPPSRHSRIAPSQRSSPQAISHGSLPVHPLVASVSLLPHGALPKSYFPRFPSVHLVIPVSLLPHEALPKLFPTVSLPSTLSSLPYRSFPPELSPSYFSQFPHRLPSRHSRIAPSHRSSPQAISHGFPSVHPVVTRIAPSHRSSPQAIPHGFPSVHPLVTHLMYRSFPPKLSPCYFPRFPLRPPNRCFHPFPIDQVRLLRAKYLIGYL